MRTKMTMEPATTLRAKEAAAYLSLSRSTLAKWRCTGKGPLFHYLGERLVYYRKDELDDWLAKCDQRPPTSRRPA